MQKFFHKINSGTQTCDQELKSQNTCDATSSRVHFLNIKKSSTSFNTLAYYNTSVVDVNAASRIICANLTNQFIQHNKYET
jgi:hypothetical protein